MIKALFTKIQEFFAPPHQGLEIETLQSKVVSPIINLTLGIIAFYLVFYFVAFYIGEREPGIYQVLLLLLFVIFYFLRRFIHLKGHLNDASAGFVLLSWLGIVVGFLFFENGIRAPIYTGLLILVIAYITLLHGLKAGIFLASLTLVINLFIIWQEMQGIYHVDPLLPNPWYTLIGQGISFLAIIFVVRVIVENLNSSLDQAKLEAKRRREAEEKIRGLYQSLEERVAKRTAEVEQSYESLKSFSYTISHDLRAPLRAIAGYSHILNADLKDTLDEEYQEYLQRIENTAKSMDEMIDGLLNLAAISHQEFIAEEIDLSPIVREILDNLQINEPKRWVNVRISPDAVAWGDEKLFLILLHQLLHNAWKFTSIREIGEIEFSWVDREEGRVFFVQDNGIGFEPEYMDTVFNPFQTLHNEEGLKGLGLGLATVQRIIHRHGGRIWAKSQKGVGSTFYFSLYKNK